MSNLLQLLNEAEEKGVGINKKDALGRTLVFSIEDVETAKVFKDKGWNLSLSDNKNQTLLTEAVKKDLVSLAKWLLENTSLDVNYEDDYGKTVVFYVQSLEMLNLLIEHGADLNYSDVELKTVAHNAWKKEDVDIIKRLAEAGVSFKEVDIVGNNPLFFQNEVVIIEEMLKHGLKLKDINYHGTNAITEWYKDGKKELVQWYKDNKEQLKKDGLVELEFNLTE